MESEDYDMEEDYRYRPPVVWRYRVLSRCRTVYKTLRYCRKYRYGPRRPHHHLGEENEEDTDEITDSTEEENTYYRWRCISRKTSFRLCSQYLYRYRYHYR